MAPRVYCGEPDPVKENRTLVVAISIWPPLVFNCSDFPTLTRHMDTCPFPGFDAENMGVFLKHLGVTNYRFHVFDKRVTSSGAFVNGSWTNIMGLIMNGTVDTILGGYQRTETRAKDFDFTYPMLQVKPVFVVREKESSFIEKAMGVFRGFDGKVWLVILTVFIAEVVALLCVNYVQMAGHGLWTPTNMIWNMFRYFIIQVDGPIRHTTYTGNLLILIFGLVNVLLVSLYQGLLLTQLLHPPEVLPFKDADEMILSIASGEYHLITYYPGHWYFQDLETSNGEHFIKMREATRNNPPVIVEDKMKVLDMVQAGNYILPVDTDGEVLYMAKRHYCGLSFIEKGLPSQYRHYLFKKGSAWLPLINSATVAHQTFSISQWEKYFSAKSNVRDPNGEEVQCIPPDTKVKPLSVHTLLGLVCLFIVGATVAGLVFVMESMDIVQRMLGKKMFGSETDFGKHIKESFRKRQIVSPSSETQLTTPNNPTEVDFSKKEFSFKAAYWSPMPPIAN